MPFLPSGFTSCMFTAVIGIGGLSAFSVSRWRKGSVSAVIIDDDSQAGVVVFKKLIFMFKGIYLGIQTVNIIL